MSQINCEACEDLKTYAPDFVANGVTKNVCTSLQNNTGLGANGSHTNCDDLDDANDCLVGQLSEEIDAYDTCEWKDYMKQFAPNVHTMLKAMICSDCGEWSNIESINDKLTDICKLLESVVAPPLADYAVLPLSTGRSVGTAVASRVRFHADDGTLNPYTKHSQGIGISYAKLAVTSCVTGKRRVYEWIQPKIYMTYIKEGTKDGDVLWYAKRSDIQAASGFTDFLWKTFTESSWTWNDSEVNNGSSLGKGIYLKITVDPGNMGNDYIGVEYHGTTYPYEQTLGYDVYATPLGNVPRLYTHYE